MSQSGLTGRALSKKIHKTESEISVWRNNRREPGRENAELLADALGTTKAWIEDGRGDPPGSIAARAKPQSDHADGIRQRISREVVGYWTRKHEGAAPAELSHRQRVIVEMTAAALRDKDAQVIAEFVVKVMLDSMESPYRGEKSGGSKRVGA